MTSHYKHIEGVPIININENSYGGANLGTDRGEDSALALGALGWILAEDRRAQRFLDLTGLTPETLREELSAPSTHRAILEFLCSHEPDLIAAAESLGIKPADLAAPLERLVR